MGTSGRPRVFAADMVTSEPMESGSGMFRQMLLGPDETPNFMMRRFTMEPGGSAPNHTNSVEHEQYVLEGTAKVGIGDKVYDVSAGDVLFIPPGVPHWYEVTGNSPYVFLCLGPNAPDEVKLVDKA